MSETANRRVRVSLSLSKKQEECVMEYLTRSTCFWNFLIHHLKEEIDEYIRTRGRQVAYDRLKEKADSYTKLIIYGRNISKDASSSEIAVESSWEPFITQMSDLPSSSLRQRVEDLLEAFKAYVEKDNPSANRRPRAKTERSAQAILLERPYFTLKNSTLTIDGFLPFELELPELDFNEEVQSLVLGKRAAITEENEKRYGPLQEAYFLLIN